MRAVIEVTPWDILEGNRSCRRCPLALAVLRSFTALELGQVSIIKAAACFLLLKLDADRGFHIRLSHRAKRFIHRFDRYNDASPATFYVTIPEEIAPELGYVPPGQSRPAEIALP